MFRCSAGRCARCYDGTRGGHITSAPTATSTFYIGDVLIALSAYLAIGAPGGGGHGGDLHGLWAVILIAVILIGALVMFLRSRR